MSLAFVRDEKASPHLRIGDNVFVGRNTVLSIHAPIVIGASNLIGAYCYITSCNHEFKKPCRAHAARRGYTFAPVTIRDRSLARNSRCHFAGSHHRRGGHSWRRLGGDQKYSGVRNLGRYTGPVYRAPPVNGSRPYS